jgi:hypothetical protein
MRILLATILIAATGYVLGLFLPWWSIAIAAFLIALLLIRHLGMAFLTGFAGIFLLWGLIAMWIDITNQGLLSHKIAQLIPLGGSSVLLVLVTALIGGIVGGFASMAGASLRPVSRHR